MYEYGTAAKHAIQHVMEQKKGGTFLLSGEKGLGKCAAAKQIAAHVLGRKESVLTSSPDYFYMKATDGVIKVENLKELKHFISFIPSEAPVKVCIIDDANTMTAAAQNALLKTFEENSDSNLFLLVAHEPLLDTIVSRSFLIPFYALPDKVMTSLYPNESRTMLSLADGHPGRIDLLKGGALCSEMELIVSCLTTMKQKRELLEVFHLVKEKDKENFYEKFDHESIRYSLKAICDLFTSAVAGEDGECQKHMRTIYSEDDMLLICSDLQDAIVSMKQKGKFSRNDFFDLVRVMVA